MEALILSCSTGGGHNAAGHAIEKKLQARGWKTTFMDPYTLRSEKLARQVGHAYLSLVGLSPALFGKVYQVGRWYDHAMRQFHLPNPILRIQRKTALALHAWLQTHPVDLIICSHPYPGLMITWLKNHQYALSPSLMIATDYTCIPFEEAVKTDWMVIPHPDLAREFESHGIPSSRLICTGIPIDPKLGIFTSKTRACRSLGLDPDERCILIGAGSMGLDGLWSIIKALRPLMEHYPDIHLLVLCGTNESLKARVESLHNSRITPVGYTRRMYEYLHAVSLLITKPGGLSITEAAACGTPMILTGAIPGCEDHNARFFADRHLAWSVPDLAQLPETVAHLLEKKVQDKRQPHLFFRQSTDRLADWCEAAAALNNRQWARDWSFHN